LGASELAEITTKVGSPDVVEPALSGWISKNPSQAPFRKRGDFEFPSLLKIGFGGNFRNIKIRIHPGIACIGSRPGALREP
jgi:hypothetical protein